MQAPDILLQRERVAIGDRRADMRQERRKDDAVLAIDVGGRRVGGVRASWLFFLTFHRRPSMRPGNCQDQV